MLLSLRLVIVMSLAGYSSSAVDAAMHSPAAMEAVQVEVLQSLSHNHSAMSVDNTNDRQSPADSKGLKKNCCQELCGVAAINCSGAVLRHPLLRPVHSLVDDKCHIGLPPQIHLPPNI